MAVGFVLLAGCSGDGDAASTTTASTTTSSVAEPVPDDGFRWWNDRVFYEIFVRSFKDSDGDGIGDFAGLTASLDYLNDGDPATTDDLGITGIWLMPVFPSPSYHGYDVTDYRSVNPDYGSMADFEAFLEAAHARGIAVIIDLVLNHTSSEHPWFTASQAGDPTYRDWYIWSDTDPATTGPWGQDVWHEGGNGYYFGLFWEGMPDLNLENDAVTAELHDVARFWLEDVGVDGFRLDAARHLIEEGDVMADTPSTVRWLETFTEYVHGVAPDAMVLGEVWSPTLDVAGYVPDALDLAFEFALSDAGGNAAAHGDAAVLEAAAERVRGAYPDDQYATFLSNHDMDRVMSSVGGDVSLAKTAAVWLLTSPGVPFVYYGEEVGLEGTKPDERIRTPMPWTGDPPGVGFSSGEPWEPVDSGFAVHNVAGEDADPASLLNLYRELIHLRNDSSALRRGSTIDVETGTSTVLAYLRSDGDDHVLVIGNLGADAAALSLDLAEGPLQGMRGVLTIVGPGAVAPAVTDRGGFLDYHPVDSLPGHGSLVLRFTADEQPPPPSTTTTTSPSAAATEEDAAVAVDFLTAASGWEGMVAPGFLLRAADQTLGWDDEIGEEAVADWNGDGRYTVADLFAGQAASTRVFRQQALPDCVPAGTSISCSVAMDDLFYRLAGVAPPPEEFRIKVADGLVAEFETIVPEPSPDREAAGQAWVEQFLPFEQWVSAIYPDRYGDLFTGSCCAGDATNLIFTPDNVDAWEALLTEWAPAG